MSKVVIYIQDESSAESDIRTAISEIYEEVDRICMDNDIAHYEVEEVNDEGH